MRISHRISGGCDMGCDIRGRQIRNEHVSECEHKL